MDMASKENNQETISSTTSENILFPEVLNVAKSWMMDFTFLSLCRYFRDGNSEKFVKMLRTFEAIVDDDIDLQDHQLKKRSICCFLARVVDAKKLEVHYHNDELVTPLMSAVTVWDTMEDIVNNDALFENVKCLLIVQAVSVYLEKGNSLRAKEALEWLAQESKISEKLHGRLASVVKNKDLYDQLLMSFTYSRLLDSINGLLDSYLTEHPSDFLLKAASKVAEARHEKMGRTKCEQDNMESDSQIEDSDNRKEGEKEISSGLTIRPKKKLLSTRRGQLWKPETVKKKSGPSHRNTQLKVSRMSYGSEKPENTTCSQRRRTKRRWTFEEDALLRAGVKHCGEGNWAMILREYDFGSRTGVMLKDRWRTLIQTCKVSSYD